MFKLESYLTPLILNYVDKYIKNLKPEDSQFSLWGGDAVFSNLDLRLDVLEQELQLPFTFVNGHIHELRIHVPWTKLGSEPVIITINTIECILKLCDGGDGAEGESQKVIQSRKSSRNIKKLEMTDTPPGYVQSLINRVISNICIICNNLILKYVEDDVVLSLNIKSVELLNVNDRWERAFVDPNVTVRKVIHMQDLTVCLDKRDASGKIETYQDPLLYRCSTTWRLYSIYNSPLSKYPILTRIHMYCENLEFSLTDQQLPMFLRLMYLCIALQNRGTFREKDSSDSNDEGAETRVNVLEDTSDSESQSHEESWGSWAWSFIPEVPIWSYAGDEEEQERESNVLLAKKIFQFGIFINKASCKLKQTIISQDSFCGTPKCTFMPLMILNFYGCSLELTCKGKDFLNVQAGVTGATVTGLEDCVCGYQDFSANDNERKVFVKSGVPPSSGHPYSFLSSSLFDPLAPENCGQTRKYSFNHDDHFTTLTEEVMVQRFPAFALDYLYELEIPEEWLDRLSTVTTLFLEESNWHESSVCRFVFGPLCIDLTSSFVHRLMKLIHSVKDYDYPCYTLPRKTMGRINNIDNGTIEELEEFVPSRQYHLTLLKPVIRLFVAGHSSSTKQESKKGKKKRAKAVKTPKGNEPQFYLEIYAECIDLQASVPMYPSRLVAIVNNHLSQVLLHHCYSSESYKLFGLEMSLQKEGNQNLSEPIIQRASLTLFKKSLIFPDSWSTYDDLTLQEYSFECTNISIQLCEIRFLALISIYHSWTVKYLNTVGLQKLKAKVMTSQAGPQQLFGEICDIKFLLLKAQKLSFARTSVALISIKFKNEENLSILFHAPEFTQCVHKCINNKDCGDDDKEGLQGKKFLQFILQIPKDHGEISPVLVMHISGSTFCLEPALLEWLSSTSLANFSASVNLEPEKLHVTFADLEDESTDSNNSMVTPDASTSQTLTKSQSTTFVGNTSELQKTVEDILFQHSEFLSHLILEIEIGACTGLLPHSNWSIEHAEDITVLQAWKIAAASGSLKEAFIFNFPQFRMRNNSSISTFQEDLWQCSIPINCLVEEKKSQDCFPWNLEINSCSIYSISMEGDKMNKDYLLQPTTVSATIALSLKSNQNQIALCVHMDSKFLGISLSAAQTTLLVDCIKSSAVLISFCDEIKSWISCFQLKHPEVSKLGSINPETDLQENVCHTPIKNEDVSCNKSSDNAHSDWKQKKLSLWSQLTLSKLSIMLFGKLLPESKYENFKVDVEVEEIISSLDIQDIYSKIKVKLTSLTANCFTSREEIKEEWVRGPYDGVILLCNDMVPKTVKSATAATGSTCPAQHTIVKSDNQPFLLATYTKALCANAAKKWTSKENSGDKLEGHDYISEIDIKVKSFDLILWMSLFDVTYQIFFPFLKLYQSANQSPVSVILEPKYPTGINFCSQNLPLIYIETNIIQLYLPDNSVLTLSHASHCKDDASVIERQKSTNVLLLQVDCVILTSQADNPLSRIVVDSELYNAALNSKSLSLPGAAIEDRQYQMDINGFALGSLSGRSILLNKNIKKDPVLHHPLTMGENPALEWNIGVIPENRNISNDLVIINPIVSPLNIRIAVAPAIVYDNPKDDIKKKIIVAGISVEVSVTSDICLYLSINQLSFIYSLLKTNLKFLFDTFTDLPNLTVSNSSEYTGNVYDEQKPEEFPFTIPSCFTHISSNLCAKSCKIEKSEQYDFVPFEILVTAGVVSVMFYYHDSKSDDLSDTNTCNNYENQDIQDESAEYHHKNLNIFEEKENTFNETTKRSSDNGKSLYHPSNLHPFLCICITEPHSYIMCRPSSQKFESSCFDLQLCGSPTNYVVEKPHESYTPVNDDFSLPYLETKHGEPKAKTGIPPSFFTISCKDFFNCPACIKVFVERPVKFNLRTEMCDSALNFIQRFQSELANINMQLNSETEESSLQLEKVPEFSAKVNVFKLFKNFNLYTTQVVLEIVPTSTYNCHKLVLTSADLSMEIGIETYKDELKNLDLNMDMTGFTLQMCSSNQTWNFLQPLTFALHMRCRLNPWFQIELRLIGESMLFNLSIHNILKLKYFLETLHDQIQKQVENFKNIINIQESMDASYEREQVSSMEAKQWYHWNDDLRKGSFQFIQACDNDSQPKVQEIIFNRASSNQPASMTWRYPEPRALTKIEVSPVPFQCEEGKHSKDRQVLTCYLQYWNFSQQEYLNLCDFMLSETEHCSLDLPDLNSDSLAVSDKWRVLLDCRSYLDDDGVLGIESPCLSPLALAACMSIDSCFDPSLIPVIQIQASFELFKISTYNYFEKTGNSPALYPYEFDDAAPENQEFAILRLMNPCFSCTKWSSKLKLSFSSGIVCEILEYRNLSMLPIISPVDIHCKASINFKKEQGPIYDVDFVLHPCFFRITQSILHTLTFTMYSISKDFANLKNGLYCSEYVLPNYYLICNNIQESIRFGQVDTEEYIILSPMKMHAYSWWCHKKNQMLRISFGSSNWKWSQAFSIDKEGRQLIIVDNNFSLTINVKQLSNLQKQVIIDGQLVVHSQLSFPVQLKCDFRSNPQSKAKGSNMFFIKSLAPDSCTPAFLLSGDQQKCFRLSVTGRIDSQSWSEEVTFGDNKLIKIPWYGSFQNAWCQVASQSFDIGSIYIVVFLCPLFILRSNLPVPLTIDVVPSNPDATYEVDLFGKGKEVKLLEGLEWDHKLKLKLKTENDEYLDTINVSVQDLSDIPLTIFDENNDLEKVCSKMRPIQDKMWPYSSLERIDQSAVYHDSVYLCINYREDLISATPTNAAIPDFKVDRSQRWYGLNTLLIDVKPHAMLVNRLEKNLFLYDKKGLQWTLPPKAIAMPSNVHEGFVLAVEINEQHSRSPLILVEDTSEVIPEAIASDAFSFSVTSPLRVPQNGSVNVFIKSQTCSQACLFKLKCEIHEGIIILTAFPVMSILNKTGRKLAYALSYLSSDAKNVIFPVTFSDSFVLAEAEYCETLLFFSEVNSDYPSAELLHLDFYVFLSAYGNDDQSWSYPLCLHSFLVGNNRHTLSLPISSNTKHTTIPVVISSHIWEGMVFLIIHNDPSPLLLLHNQTSMELFYGQSASETEGKYVYEELQKHKTIPVIKPNCSAHYTFPSLHSKFPTISERIPMLRLGSVSKDNICVWSAPFQINNDKQFVHILGICDFMIHCRTVGHTVYLYIDPVNRIELTAKEVRSRIALATNSSIPSVESHGSNEQAKSKSSTRKFDSSLKRKSSSASKLMIKDLSNSFGKIPFILYMNIRIVHASFILCDELKEINKSSEVLRLNIDNAILFSRPKSGNACDRLQEVFLCFEHVQLDNQMDGENNVVYDFPVILQRKLDSSMENLEVPEDDVFLPNKVKENSVFVLNAIIELPSVECDNLTVQSLNVNLLPVSLCIEDTFCYKVIDLMKSYAPANLHKHYLPWYIVYFPKSVMNVSSTIITPVHFRELKVNIPEITLSLHASLKLYLSLENSVLKFQPFEKQDLFSSSYEIGRTFVLHYLTGALFRAGWVVGSLDLLGNPAGFARAVGAGMSDFVYLPYRGLLRGPKAFISGLSSGAVSLFTQISSGAITCISSLASSISRNMDFLSLDDEHLARQELLRHHLPHGVSEGLIQGLSGLGLSLLSAVAGIADHPLQAILSPATPMKTASGIVSGLGKGIVGVFTKPIGGAAELLSQTGYGLLHGAGWLTPPRRQYQPMTMSLDVVPSSCLKYACKIAQCTSLGEILLSVEASYVHENGEYEKNILLLTSEALCILAEDEITLNATFALSEIGCKKAESDQSTLVIVPTSVYKKQALSESGRVDKVVEYLLKSHEENPCLAQDDSSDFLSKSTSSCHIFYLYPKDRSLFLTLFSFAKSKAMKKGFFADY